MKTLRKSLFLGSLLLASMLLFSQCMGNKSKLEVMAKSINFLTPIEMSSGFVLSKVELAADTALQFNYQIAGLQHVSLSPEQRNSMEQHILNDLVEQEHFAELKAMKTTLIYSMRNDADKELFNIVLPYERYGQLKPMAERSAYELIEEVARLMKSHLPMDVDEYVSLIAVEPVMPNILQYNYKLRTDMDLGDVAKFKEGLVQMLKTPQMDVLRNKKASFRYIYRNSKDEEVMRIDITEEDYK